MKSSRQVTKQLKKIVKYQDKVMRKNTMGNVIYVYLLAYYKAVH